MLLLLCIITHGQQQYRTCIYTNGRLTPSHSSIDALNIATTNLAPLMAEQCTYTHGRWTPHQLSIDALNTTTPNLADLYIYRTMHIYPWQIDPQSLKHRCLEYCYTTLGTSNSRTMHMYLWQMDPQSVKHRCLEYHSTKLGRSIYI